MHKEKERAKDDETQRKGEQVLFLSPRLHSFRALSLGKGEKCETNTNFSVPKSLPIWTKIANLIENFRFANVGQLAGLGRQKEMGSKTGNLLMWKKISCLKKFTEMTSRKLTSGKADGFSISMSQFRVNPAQLWKLESKRALLILWHCTTSEQEFPSVKGLRERNRLIFQEEGRP